MSSSLQPGNNHRAAVVLTSLPVLSRKRLCRVLSDGRERKSPSTAISQPASGSGPGTASNRRRMHNASRSRMGPFGIISVQGATNWLLPSLGRSCWHRVLTGTRSPASLPDPRRLPPQTKPTSTTTASSLPRFRDVNARRCAGLPLV